MGRTAALVITAGLLLVGTARAIPAQTGDAGAAVRGSDAAPRAILASAPSGTVPLPAPSRAVRILSAAGGLASLRDLRRRPG
ncbi:MAG: hypothetical protein KDA50_03265 [Rhodobacteraceae bacterium]|nr:hypothetical protein [Paracoccaceae bacterium]